MKFNDGLTVPKTYVVYTKVGFVSAFWEWDFWQIREHLVYLCRQDFSRTFFLNCFTLLFKESTLKNFNFWFDWLLLMLDCDLWSGIPGNHCKLHRLLLWYTATTEFLVLFFRNWLFFNIWKLSKVDAGINLMLSAEMRYWSFRASSYIISLWADYD